MRIASLMLLLIAVFSVTSGIFYFQDDAHISYFLFAIGLIFTGKAAYILSGIKQST